MIKIWPWSRFARDQMTITSMASQWAISCGEEIRLQNRIAELQEQMLGHSKRAIALGTELQALKLSASGLRAQLNTEAVAAVNARGEAMRLRAELESKSRSSVVIYPPTERSDTRKAELQQELDAAAPPKNPSHDFSELDEFDGAGYFHNGWPFGSGTQ